MFEKKYIPNSTFSFLLGHWCVMWWAKGYGCLWAMEDAFEEKLYSRWCNLMHDYTLALQEGEGLGGMKAIWQIWERFNSKCFDIKCTYGRNAWRRGVARSREVVEWHGGKGVCPNAFVYMLMKGFCTVGNAREGIRILKRKLDNGCLLNKSTYSIFIEGLYESELEEKVIMVSLGGVDPNSWMFFKPCLLAIWMLKEF